MKKRTTAVLLSVPAKISRPIGDIDYGAAIRQEVIDRWHLCVDRVYTFNTPEESAKLRPQISNVEYVECLGSLRPRIATMTAFAAAQSLDTALIANADCFPIDTKLIKDIIHEVGVDDMCLLRRANLDTTRFQASQTVFHGIDAFIIGNNAAAAIPASAVWAIGDPVGDIWLPLFLIHQGFNVFGVDPHVIAHFDHDQRWDHTEWLKNARKLLAEIALDAPMFGEAFPARIRNKLINLTDKNVEAIFNEIAEFLFEKQRAVFKNPTSFNSLWMRTLKANIGPSDDYFRAYVSARGSPLRRWTIKNFARSAIAKWL